MTLTVPPLLDRPLESIAAAVSASEERAAVFQSLGAQRDQLEGTINAFELRRETCPQTVTGPLNGLPITVKDQIAVAGWPRSFGLDRVARKPDMVSAPLVERLQNLGAVVTGKTALPPNAIDFQTGNRRRGPTCNPHDVRFTTGGSTGGGAAAVASGMSLLDVGADLSGSLRLPAAWCGVTSLVPTEGRWPNDGLLPGQSCLDHFARIGLTARSVDDLRFIWHMLESEGGEPLPGTGAIRMALWSPGNMPPCDEATLHAWTQLHHRLIDTDMTIEPSAMAALFDADVYRLSGEIIGYETGALVPWPIRWLMRRDRRATETSPGFVAHIHTGYKRNAARYTDNLDQLHAHRAAAEQEWLGFDALIVPVSGVCAFEHLAPVQDQAGVRTYDKVFMTKAGGLGYFDVLTRFTLPLTMLGWPVVTVPIGRDPNGLPIGAQIAGRPGTEARLLDIAADLARSIGFR